MKTYVSALLFAALLLVLPLAANRSHAQSNDLAWLTCGPLLNGTAKVLARRLKLPPSELDSIGDLICGIGQIVDDTRKRSGPKRDPLSRQSAQQYYCADPAYAAYCDKTPPSLAQAASGGARSEFENTWIARCLSRDLTAQDCVLSIFQSN